MCVAAVMAASTLRLFSTLVLTVLVVPVSSAEDHDWHFNPGRTKISFVILCFSCSFFFKKKLSRGCLLPKNTNLSPSSTPLGQKKTTFISLQRHSPHILRSGRLILHQPSTGYPVSSAPVCQPVMCNKRMRQNSLPSPPLHLSSPFSAARQDR